MKKFSRESTGIEVVEALKEYVEGKTILITGASVNGLSAETAISLTHANPSHLLLHGRTASKIDPVIEEIQRLNLSIKTTFVHADLNNFSSVHEAAALIIRKTSQLDILINNAGIMAVKEYSLSADGIESQLATNHVSHFLLTNLLMPKILAAGPAARIVNLTSDGYLIGPFRFADHNFSAGRAYDLWSGYGQSKTANILFTKALAAKLKNKGVAAFAVHPGVIMETGLGKHEPDFDELNAITKRNTGKEFVLDLPPKNRQAGCATTLVAALDPRIAGESGSWLVDCKKRELEPRVESAEDAERLWELSETLVGEKFPL